MELDKRIKSLSDVLTCFDIERAKDFLGEKGYFADDLYYFTDLGSCTYGTLTDACDDQAGPFHMREGNAYRQLFIPECSLKSKEKRYRPYTFMEFTDKFTVGRPIKFRRKGMIGHERYLILNGYEHERDCDQTITYVYIGPIPYTFNELFNNYEWQEHYTEDFEPFGIEEEK